MSAGGSPLRMGSNGSDRNLIFAEECFLERYQKILWADELQPLCNVLPLLCRATFVADRSVITRRVLDYRPTCGKRGLRAVSQSARPGLTHLAVRSKIPAGAKVKKQREYAEQVAQEIRSVVEEARCAGSLRVLVLDLEHLVSDLVGGSARRLQCDDICLVIFKYPQLKSLILKGILLTPSTFKLLEEHAGISRFHLGTRWGTVSYDSESKCAAVVVDGDLSQVEEGVFIAEDVCAVGDLLYSKGDLVTLHLASAYPTWVDDGYETLLAFRSLKDLTATDTIVDVFEWQEEALNTLSFWFGGKHALVLNLHDHPSSISCKRPGDKVLYTAGKIYLQPWRPWTKAYAEEIADEDESIEVQWVSDSMSGTS
eukprot:TRINITY_DN19018_c0_g1_i1.p1 TRINITY_DN19018_c0_g1~~TRINITY_DN19018_c0_g1_i1.p1  ORF type:complete len:369 (+),score=8.07 TRINITY_DN19018_c0_g1_i1:27-1133(+)